MADGIVYTDIDRANWILEPQITRWRHRWRGHRESYKINLEIDQLGYDFKNMLVDLNGYASHLNSAITIAYEGGEVDDVDFDWESGLEDVELEGLENLSVRIQFLENRINNLGG